MKKKRKMRKLFGRGNYSEEEMIRRRKWFRRGNYSEKEKKLNDPDQRERRENKNE